MTDALRSELSNSKEELLRFLSDAALRETEWNSHITCDLPDVAHSIGTEPDIIDHEIAWPLAWTKADLRPDQGFVEVGAKCADEIAQLAKVLRANPHPIEALRVDDFELPACRAMMQDVKRELVDGVGFAVIDRLDIEAIGQEEARAIHWLLCSMIERPVAQKWSGAMYYDVTDLGKRSMRAVNTNDDMNYHTDNSFNVCPPNYVGLLCMQKAKSGGVSKIVNFAAVHNELRRKNPNLLRRAYRSFAFHRQNEHAPGEQAIIRKPMFENQNGLMTGRISSFHVRTGYAFAGEPLDAEGDAVLNMFEQILNNDAMAHEFWFEPGQIQIVDNRRLGHKRTSYKDWDEPERKRRLMRLWLRDQNRPFYNG